MTEKTEYENFADIMATTKEAIDKFKADIVAASVAFKAAITAMDKDLPKLPEDLQRAWFASYSSQLGAVETAYSEALS